MRFFTGKTPDGSINIICSRQASNLYSVTVSGHRIVVPVKMEQELKEIVSKYINGFGYDKNELL